METAKEELAKNVRRRVRQDKGEVGDLPKPCNPISGVEASARAMEILKELDKSASAIIILIAMMLMPMISHAQLSVSYSPNSVVAWGQAHGSQMVSAEYSRVGIMSITRDPRNYLFDRNGGRAPNNVVGIYAIPFQAEYKFLTGRIGGIYFNKPAPTSKSSQTNIYMSVGIQHRFNKVLLKAEYIHISNAWTSHINMGYDFPTLSLAVDL